MKHHKDYPLISTKKIILSLRKLKKEVKLTKKFIAKSKSINNLWKYVK